MSDDFPSVTAAALQGTHGALQVIGLAKRADQVQLGFQEVDMLLGVRQDLDQQFAAEIVLCGLEGPTGRIGVLAVDQQLEVGKSVAIDVERQGGLVGR